MTFDVNAPGGTKYDRERPYGEAERHLASWKKVQRIASLLRWVELVFAIGVAIGALAYWIG